MMEGFYCQYGPISKVPGKILGYELVLYYMSYTLSMVGLYSSDAGVSAP